MDSPLAEDKFAVFDPNCLPAPAHQVHLDAAGRLVINGLMSNMLEFELGPQLAIGAGEEVQIELRRDALRIVVSRGEAPAGTF